MSESANQRVRLCSDVESSMQASQTDASTLRSEMVSKIVVTEQERFG